MVNHRIDIRGPMVPNNYAWYYKFFDEECACPNDVSRVLEKAEAGDQVDVYIASDGGVATVGTEIYTLLRDAAGRLDIRIHVTGAACSAASVAAMASWCEMSPTALLMVHCTSTEGSGNRAAMEHAAEMLSAADRAICQAYMAKSGMPEEEALSMMEHETWLTADQAVERGLADAVMFEETIPDTVAAASGGFRLPSEEQMGRAKALMQAEEEKQAEDRLRTAHNAAALLELAGRRRQP